ncbi:flagellar assembly factor FliW [Paenibacillus uliginis N3/975]|uniref:Flagellar assembly factor FliW n=1 Tax=Paenibacillus uliginis N3/975 TaxID=1313296 RepID=A0A1X7GBI2_9BACL|nr:flagellar assembly protein FliW [Paenibacillus uliginis]SMF67210.1 flagellar assembly factor FliW [Paenibacillus uliginis N3/975]
MIIHTSMWGELDTPESQIYNFPKGIPGFEEEHQFALIDEEDSPFVYMQSLKQKHLTFVMADPFLFYPDYEFDLPDTDAEELCIDDAISVKCIITVREKIEESSINLLAPLVFNPQQRLGKQVVLQGVPYRTSHRLWNDSVDENGRDGV